MKNVRIWFSKQGNMRFISHLDLNRCMIRAIQRSKLPIWRTEGFNPHPFINFSIPLSLGMCGLKESMDVKIVEDTQFEEIMHKFNLQLPEGLCVTAVTEPLMKMSEIGYAQFTIIIHSNSVCSAEVSRDLKSFLDKSEIIVEKRTKSAVKTLNIKDYFTSYDIVECNDGINLKIVLPAGNKLNINPFLLLDTYVKQTVIEHINYVVFRDCLFNENMEEFC